MLFTGFVANARYYALNILEELDTANEVIAHTNRIFYDIIL